MAQAHSTGCHAISAHPVCMCCAVSHACVPHTPLMNVYQKRGLGECLWMLVTIFPPMIINALAHGSFLPFLPQVRHGL
jgi:hypothetical protein